MVDKGIAFDGLMQAMRQGDPADVVDMMTSATAELGGSDVIIYLVDFEQEVLEPLPDYATHDELPRAEDVATTIAGRAFLRRQATTSERPDGTRVWVPIIEGSDPTGVLALTISAPDEATVEACENLGVLAGYLIATQARVTDLYNLHRRRKSMSLAASMQWDLLPPLTFASRSVAVAGMLEPAYDVGGDCFDSALNGSNLDVAIMDSMGHGLRSALISALAMGCYRHDRREGRSLEGIHHNLDKTLASEGGGEAFVTGQIGRLDLRSGALRWINAGHPPPMLVRHGRVVGPLDAPTLPPWALGPGDVEVTTTALEPGDSLLFYTDGVIEARGARREDFGMARLEDIIGQHASDELPIRMIVRQIVRAVLQHHGGQLHDDATVLMIHWLGDRTHREAGADSRYAAHG